MPLEPEQWEEAIDLNQKGHLSLSEISRVYGVSRQAVHQMFRKRGVIPLGPLTVFKCAQCGVDAYRARSALTRVKHSFCSRSCAVEFMKKAR